MSKSRLSSEELEEIKVNEAEIEYLLASVEKARRFNVGDFLIRFNGDEKKAEQNSYFIERRFQVVHVDKNGVCYIKEVMGTKNSSWIMAMTGLIVAAEIAGIRRRGHTDYDDYRYELDPLYEDHIIMQQEGKYDPAMAQSTKSKLHREITAHNKSLKIKTNRSIEVLKFMRDIKVGDTFWFSNVTSFIVQEVKPLPNRAPTGYANDPMILGVTNKGKNLKLGIFDLTRKAVYTACPRSYKELKA